MITLPERVSYDSLTGEVIDQNVLAMLERQTGTDVTLECESCLVSWRCHWFNWESPHHRSSCHACRAHKSVRAVGWLE